MWSLAEQGDLIFQQSQTHAILNMIMLTFAKNVAHVIRVPIEYFAIVLEVLLAKLWNYVEIIRFGTLNAYYRVISFYQFAAILG